MADKLLKTLDFGTGDVYYPAPEWDNIQNKPEDLGSGGTADSVEWDNVQNKPFTKEVIESDTFIPSQQTVDEIASVLFSELLGAEAIAYSMGETTSESLFNGAVLTVATPNGMATIDDTVSTGSSAIENETEEMILGFLCGATVVLIAKADIPYSDDLVLSKGAYICLVPDYVAAGGSIVSLKLYNGTFTKTTETINPDAISADSLPKGWVNNLIDWEYKFDPTKGYDATDANETLGITWNLQRVGDAVAAESFDGKKIVTRTNGSEVYVDNITTDNIGSYTLAGLLVQETDTDTIPAGVYVGKADYGNGNYAEVLGVYDPSVEGNLFYGNMMAVEKQFYLMSSTENSTKKFKITVDDNGTLTATEVTS